MIVRRRSRTGRARYSDEALIFSKLVPRGETKVKKRASVALSALIVMSSAALSALLGFALQIFVAHYYGTRPEMDAFLNASTVPIVLFGVFNWALVSALVPTFSEYVSQGKSGEAARLGSTVLNSLFVTTSVLAVISWLLAPLFVPVIARGFPPAEQALVVQMVRWLLPGVIATCLSGVCSALLNAHHRFFASSLVWVASNLTTIVVVVIFHGSLGIFALVLGSVLGLFAQLLVQLPSIFQLRLYRPEFNWRHPGLAKAWALFLPVTIGSGAGQINLAFDRYFASTLSSGSTAALGYTTKLAFLPIQIVAAAIGTVIFPLIAGQFANSDRVAMRRSISLALRMVGFIVIPCAAGMAALAYPIVQTLFQRGAFGPDSTASCASLIPFACIPLIATSYNSVLGRACYACKEMPMAVVSSTASVTINVILSATFLPILGARGLLLSNGIAGLVLMVFLLMLLWRLIGGFDWKSLLWSLCRIVFASTAMAAALLWIRSFGFFVGTTMLSRSFGLMVLIIIGVAVYFVASRALGLEELTMVVKKVREKLAPRPGRSRTSEVAPVA